MSPTLEAQSLNYGTAREALRESFSSFVSEGLLNVSLFLKIQGEIFVLPSGTTALLIQNNILRMYFLNKSYVSLC